MADPFIGPPSLPDSLYGLPEDELEEINSKQEPAELASEPLELPSLVDEGASGSPAVAQLPGFEGLDSALIESIKKDLADDSKWTGVPKDLLEGLRSDFGITPKNPNDTSPEDWAKQNPVAAKVEEASQVAQTIFGHTFGLAGEAAKVGQEFRDSMPLPVQIGLGRGSLPDVMADTIPEAGKVIEGGLGKLSGLADSMRTKASPLHEPLTNVAGGIDATVETARLMNPFPTSKEGVATGLATMGALEAGFGPAQKAGIGLSKTIGDTFEKVSEYLPGASILRDAFLAKKTLAKDNAALKQRVSNLGREMNNLKDTIVEKETTNAGFLDDAIEYGALAKKGMEFQEDMAKAPLASRSEALKARPSMQQKYSMDDVVKQAESVRDDLTGVIATSQDAVVNKIVSQYLDKNIPDAMAEGNIGGSGWGLNKKDGSLFKIEAPEFTLADLMKDRGRLGKAYMRHKTKGVLNNEQTTAILKLQSILDDFIEKKLTEQPWHWGEKPTERWEQGVAVKDTKPVIEKRVGHDPEALAEIKQLRGDWHTFYKRYASDTAIAIKKAPVSEIINKIGKNATAVEEAKALLPTYSFEKLANHNAKLLVRDMGKSADPLAFLEKQFSDNPGYYERLLGQDQVNSLRVLAKEKINYAGMQKEMEGLGDRINKSMSYSKRKRDFEMFSNFRREGERAKIAASLGAGATSVATGLLMLKSMPVVAGGLITLGIAPGAFALAYYAGGRGLRAAAEKALSNSMRLGKMASEKDLALLRGMSMQGGKQDEKSKR